MTRHPDQSSPRGAAPTPAAAPEGDEVVSAYDPDVPVLVERVMALRARIARDRRVLVGITGEPGAGKSTLAAAVVAGLAERGTTAVLVPMDGFHLANVALAELGRADRKGAIDTFDGAGYAALLARLVAGGSATVWAPIYDRSIEESVAGAVAVPPDTDVVLTEGNYLLVDEGPWSSVRDHLDEVWGVRVNPDSLRTERLLARHVVFGKDPAFAVDWMASVDEPNASLIRSTLGRADLVVVQTG